MCTKKRRAVPLRCFGGHHTNRDIDLQIDGEHFHSCSHCFCCRNMQTDKILMDRTHKAIISALQYMAARPMGKVYRVTFQCSESVSSISSFLSPVKLPWQQSEQSGWGEMYSGGDYNRNQFGQLPTCGINKERWRVLMCATSAARGNYKNDLKRLSHNQKSECYPWFNGLLNHFSSRFLSDRISLSSCCEGIFSHFLQSFASQFSGISGRVN